MDNEPTEREQKLIEIVLYLIGAINMYETYLHAGRKNLEWTYDGLEKIDLRNKQKEHVDYLKDTYNIPLQLKNPGDTGNAN